MEVTINDQPAITIRRQQTPAQPDPETPPPAPATPTAEELAERSRNVMKSMGWEADPAPPTAPPTQPTPAPAPTAPTPAPAAPAPGQPVAPAPEPVREPTAAELIQRTGETVGRAVADALRPQAPASPAAPAGLDLSPEDQEDLRVLNYLAESDSRHAELPNRFLAYVTALRAYRQKWEAENPGKEFDPDAEEHAEWFGANVPDINEALLERGRIDMRAEEMFQQRVKPHLDEFESRQAMQGGQPTIARNVIGGIAKVVTLADPDIAQMFIDDKGQPDLSPARVAALEAKRPLAKKIIERIIGEEVEPLLEELEKSAVPKSNYKLKPRSNPVHAVIDRIRDGAEKAMLAGPAEARVRDGRQFVTIAAIEEMQNAILASGSTRAEKEKQIGVLNDKYFTLSVDDLEAIIIENAGKKARAEIQEVEGMAKKQYSGSTPPAPQPSPAPAQPTPAPQPQAGGAKPKPPSISGQSDLVANPAAPGTPPKSIGETAVAVHFS